MRRKTNKFKMKEKDKRNVKLTADQKDSIRLLYKTEDITQKKIAVIFICIII